MLKLARDVICLDWDKRALRMVRARVAGGVIKLEDAHSHRLPNNVDSDDPQGMGQFIRQMIDRHHWRHRRVVVDVPRERAVINRLSIPPVPDTELSAAIRFQAMKELPFPIDQAVIDYLVTRRDKAKLATEVLLAAVLKDTLQRLQETIAAAGLGIDRVGLRPYANVVSVRKLHGATESGLLLLDVGPSQTEIDIISGESLAFARSVNATAPLLRGEGGVEDSRILSLSDLTDLQGADDAIEAAVSELLVEATRTVQAYKAIDPEAALERIVVAGATGLEPQLVAGLAKRFNLPCDLYDPTARLRVDPSRASELRSFSAVLGLAWGVGPEGLLELDFLNPKRPVPAGAALKRRLRIAGVAAGVAVLATIVSVAKVYADLARDVAAKKETVNKLVEERRTQVQRLIRIEEVETDWATEAIWPDHLWALSETLMDPEIRPDKNMYVEQVTFDAGSATIALRGLHATDWSVALNYEKELNELGEGTREYRAALGPWKEITGAINKFKGKADLNIELLKLKRHMDETGKRERDRKDRLKDERLRGKKPAK